jgi:streptogramin lyase
MYKTLLTSALLLIAAYCGMAQPDNTIKEGSYTIRRYAAAEGYDKSAPYYSYRDNSGRFWFFTGEGVTSFDGTEFRSYTTAEGLTEGRPTAISEDDKGNLYIATANGIAFKKSGNNQRFKVLLKLPDGGSIGGVAAIAPNDYYYIVATATDSLALCHAYNGKQTLVDIDSNNAMTAMIADHDLLYVSTEANKIYCIRQDRIIRRFDMSTTSVGNHITPFFKAPDGTLWCIGRNVCRITPSGIKDSIALPANAATEQYRVCFTGTGKRMFAMSRMKLYCYDDGQMVAAVYLTNDTTVKDTGFVSFSTGLFCDGANDLLATNIPFGICGLHKTSFYTKKGPWFMQSNGHNMTVIGQSQLVGNSPAGRTAKNKFGETALPYIDRNGNYWYLDHPAGIGRSKGSQSKPDLVYKTADPDMAGNYFTMATEDSRGSIWFQGAASLVKYEADSFHMYDEVFSPADAVLDKNDRLWLTANTYKGNSLFVSAGASLVDISDQMHFPASSIRTMVADPDGDIWMGGPRNNIYRISERGKNHFIATDSLHYPLPGPAITLQNMQFDQHGNLWAIYGQHIVVYPKGSGNRPDDRHYIHLTPDDGMDMLMGIIHFKNLQRTTEGNLVIWDGESPMLKIEELLSSYNKTGPNAYLTGLLLFNKSYNWAAEGDSLNDDGLPAHLKLPFNKNALTFRFSSVGLHNAAYFSYQYRLDGLEDKWQEADETRKAVYTSLPPGHYTFMVRAANENGILGKTESYSFVILPPWYATWWARTIGIICGILIIGMIFQLRQRAVTRKLRTEQMMTEQRLVALRAQINSHFLQNTFSFLAQSAVYEVKNVTVEAIKKVGAYMRSVLHASDHTITTLEDEINFIEEYLEIQQMLMRNRFSYTLDIGNEVDTIGVKIPAMLLQPLVENAIRYSVAGNNEGLITVTIRQDEHYVHCLVKDNGKYPVVKEDQGARYKSKGLEITRNKLHLVYARYKHHPRLNLSPNPDGGYTASVDIPLA